MKKGDKVYLVVPFERPDVVNAIDWVVQERTLIVVSNKQLRLNSHFSFHCGLIFEPSALGKEFYATPREAVDAYERNRKRGVEGARRDLERAQELYIEAAEWAAIWRTQHEPAPPPEAPPPKVRRPRAPAKRKLGEVQNDVLNSLRRFGQWSSGCGWLWDTDSNTTRIMDSLVRAGFAVCVTEKSPRGGEHKVYRPVTS